MQTVNEFCRDFQITMAVSKAEENPNMVDNSQPMHHWQVTLFFDKRVMRTYFSMGVGHKGRKPRVDEVLDCLASDAAGIDNAQSFEDWAADYGYDTDSRRAMRIYMTTQEHAEELKRFMGSEYKRLLLGTERL